MIPVAVLTKLATMGLSSEEAEAIAGMLSEVESATKDECSSALESRRAADRERKARQRHGKSRDVTGQDVTGRDKTETLSPKEKSPTPPKEITPIPEKTQRAKNRGSRVDGFKPSIDEAVAIGLSRQEAESQAVQFVDYWTGVPGKQGVKLDWPATWRNRCRSFLERNGRKPKSANLSLVETEIDWEQRLEFARERRMWPRDRWGPCPGESGCGAPKHLLRPGDGMGWNEWKAA